MESTRYLGLERHYNPWYAALKYTTLSNKMLKSTGVSWIGDFTVSHLWWCNRTRYQMPSSLPIERTNELLCVTNYLTTCTAHVYNSDSFHCTLVVHAEHSRADIQRSRLELQPERTSRRTVRCFHPFLKLSCVIVSLW